MAAAPVELSISEIRNYMLNNDCKVTNHALVKHFKQFLTKPETQNEARKLFKVYVNILATIKNENNQKYLLLRKKYIDDLPTEDVVKRAMLAASAPNDLAPGSPGGASLALEGALASPSRQPPPYVPPPKIDTPLQSTSRSLNDTKLNANEEAKAIDASTKLPVNANVSSIKTNFDETLKTAAPAEPLPQKDPEDNLDNLQVVVEKRVKAISRTNSQEDSTANKENIPRFSFSSGTSSTSVSSAASGEREATDSDADVPANPLSVKEATRKFNRMASEEEAKAISSPSNKKKPEEKQPDEKSTPDVTLAHPKAKEWIVAMARASYQDLAKLANDNPELVKLADPYTGYTALHWAAKHGNSDVIKLIAGTYKANVNARTNGGYTPLHISMQFGRADIFELLCNVYKANRDLMDWSGNKPLDYSKQSTSVSASTYSKIKAKRKHGEKDLGFLRIGSLNVRVKKTTEAFSNFLGVGNGHTLPQTGAASRHHQRSHRHHHPDHRHPAQDGMIRNHNHPHPHQHHQRHQIVSMPPLMKSTSATKTTTMTKKKTEQFGISSQKPQSEGSRASVPISSSKLDKLHKSWGSADNIPLPHATADVTVDTDAKEIMPPPKSVDSITTIKKREKGNAKRSTVVSSNATDSPRDSISSSNSSSNLNSGYSSMPTTPNQLRAPIAIGANNSNALVDSDSDSACGFGSNWSIGGSGNGTRNLQAPKI